MTTSTSVPTNWKSNIQQVVKGYETEPAKGLIHGLQKDFTQNAWGQRKNLSEGKGWGMEFTLLENKKGKFLLVQDYGTNGMTGPNMSMSEIAKLTTDLPPDHRLARFSAMNYSGGNDGAGLYGRGKLLFSAASEIGYYIFETLTEDEGYRVNYKKIIGNDLKVNELAYEGEDALSFIKETTGIEPITIYGSRIIILDPISKLVKSIEDGTFTKDIEETWWRIIDKFNARIKIQKFNGSFEFAQIPSEYRSNLEHMEVKHNIQIPGYSKIVTICFGIAKEAIREDLRNVYLYRKDMKLAEIPLNIPEELQTRYFGYIEVDEEFENEIVAIEDLEHYGFTNKRSKVFQQLKLTVNNEHDKLMTDLGYVNKKLAQDENLQNELLEVSAELDDFLNTLDLGGDTAPSDKLPKIELKWNGVQFPQDKGNNLSIGDKVSNIRFNIKNNYATPKDFQIRLSVKCENSTLLELLDSKIHINSEEIYSSNSYSFEVNSDFIKNKKHAIVLEVFPVKSTKVEKIEVPFYFEALSTVPPHHQHREFSLKLASLKLPSENSKRVNTGERITDISYKITNNSPYQATLALSISTYKGHGENELLEKVLTRKDIVINAQSELTIHCPNIEFVKENYEDKILKGPIEIRSILSAGADFGNYETADIICNNPPITVYLNEEGGFINQTFNNVQMLEGDELRSTSDGNKGNWTFSLYKDHPSYLKVIEDEELRKEYLIEEMLKQTLRVHLSEGNHSILALFSEDISDIEDLSYGELLQYSNSVIDKIQLMRLKK